MNQLTFGRKVFLLLACLALLGLVPMALLGYLSLEKAESALLKQAFGQLTSIREIKKKNLEAFFSERKGDMTVLTQMVGKMDGKYEAFYDFLKEYQKSYGYYDLFLIRPDGQAFYTAEKEQDYNTNLVNGTYANSNLGQLVRQVLESKNYGLADFAPYAPSKGAPAAFIAQPLLKNGQVELVVALQISLEAINRIMQIRDGMGNTGETYLVGPNHLMRSDSFLDPTHHSVKASFANPAKGKVDTQASIEALQGKTDVQVITDYNGNLVLSAYTPLRVEKITWALIAEIDLAEVQIPILELRQNIITFGAVLLVVVILVVLMSTWVARGEVAFLTQVVSHLSGASDQVAAASEQISSGSQQLSQGATEQAASLEETSSAMEQVAAQSKNNAQHADDALEKVDQLAKVTKESRSQAESAMALAETSRLSSEKGVKAMGQIAGAMHEIEASSAKISDIIEVINEITHQTKMLATNAAIEAARAGEQGKGFAVVADEVSKLAENSKSSAKEIASLIKESVNKARQGVELVAGGGKSLEEIAANIQGMAQLVEQISQSTQRQDQSMSQVLDLVQGIRTASQEQSNGVTQVSTAVVEMDQVTQINAANAEEAASAAEELNSQAESLKDLVWQVAQHFGVKLIQEEKLPRTQLKPHQAPARPQAPAPRQRLASASSAKRLPLGTGKGLFQWKDSFATHIASVDDQHKKLIQLINTYHQSLSQGVSTDQMNDLLQRLVDYVGYHFSHEEELFETYGYEGATGHKLEHDKLVKKLVEFRKRLAAGENVGLSLELMSFLKEWLSGHIMKKDHAYAPILREKGAN